MSKQAVVCNTHLGAARAFAFRVVGSSEDVSGRFKGLLEVGIAVGRVLHHPLADGCLGLCSGLIGVRQGQIGITAVSVSSG